MKYLLFSCLLASLLQLNSTAQTLIPLYDGKIPNSLPAENQEQEVDQKTLKNVSVPSLLMYSPEKGTANGTTIIVCPGGGYASLVMKKEGYRMAEYLTKLGITVFILKYRLPDNRIMPDKSIGPLQDAQRAIQLVRENSAKWGLDARKIGMMGFSAGGHLVASAGTHFTTPLIENKLNTSLRPDFMVLIYPLISFQKNLLHPGSLNRLLGEKPEPDKVKLFSNELQVTSQTPPTFLTHASDDVKVNVLNSVVFYEALQNAKVPSEMHLYSKGGHGFGSSPTLDEWMMRCENWLKVSGFLPAK